jgi:triosephosphate isomerase
MALHSILAANWKMNLGPESAVAYALQIRERASDLHHTSMLIAPPLVSLKSVAKALKGSAIRCGAQNVHWADSGAFTGETAPSFVKECGADFTIVGHSERRHIFGEDSAMVARRALASLKADLTTILCIGETEEERGTLQTEAVLRDQLEAVLPHVPHEKRDKLLLAYEPVWAIGTGKVATTAEIRETHAFLQSVCADRIPGAAPPILYGGSVNPTNFEEILSAPGVSGALVGGASLKLDQWLALTAISEGRSSL